MVLHTTPIINQSRWPSIHAYIHTHVEGVQPAAIHLQNPPRDIVEEVSVVRDGDHRALIVPQEPLQPRHRVGVEVVRRLCV